ncbi:MAG: type 4a pilus biogenesis protein PilO [bacterium]|nr:type 4a pilus biogenesis protein PilO [bacterium]
MNIVSIIMVLASFGLFFAYVDPTYSEIKTLSAERTGLQLMLDNSKELQAERDKFLEIYNGVTSTNRERLLKALPDNIDNVRLIIDIDEVAKKYGMRIRNFSANSSEESKVVGDSSKAHGTLTLSFTTTATYNTFLAFLKSLEQSLRVIDISSISFTASDTNPLHDYSVTIKTYWLK